MVDDFLLDAEDLEHHIADKYAFLSACRENKITLRVSKMLLAQEKVDFAGYVVGKSGISADPNKISAIAKYPKPTNLTELRSFLGLVGQLANFSVDIAATANPLRPLLRSSNQFLWNLDHDRAFQAVKDALTSPPILATLDPAAETMLQTDATRKNGLGFALLQKQDGQWRLIMCGSRFISDTESRYAMVELEFNGVEWAVKKCRLYLIGLPFFTLVIDHQPLVCILDRYTLVAVENLRLQRMKEKLSPYVFKTVWRKGSQHSIPDALSRAPVTDPTEEDISDENELNSNVRSCRDCCKSHQVPAHQVIAVGSY